MMLREEPSTWRCVLKQCWLQTQFVAVIVLEQKYKQQGGVLARAHRDHRVLLHLQRSKAVA